MQMEGMSNLMAGNLMTVNLTVGNLMTVNLMMRTVKNLQMTESLLMKKQMESQPKEQDSQQTKELMMMLQR
jgi:hypothetical protein